MPSKELLYYVHPVGECPPVVDSKQGRQLLVIGSGRDVWNDLAMLDAKNFDLMAVNDMMIYYPGRLTYGVTHHPEKLPGWRFFQDHAGTLMRTIAHRQHWGMVDHVWPIKRTGGTSGLFGVLVGLLMGYDQIVLAGIPCDDSPRFFDPPWKKHEHFGREDSHDEWFRARDAIFNDKVKSMDGNTLAWLGAPKL